MNSAQKEEYFDNLGLKNNEDLMTKYLVVGMIKMSPMFVDFSIIDYILKQSPSNKIFCSMAQKCAFFPSEVRKFNAFLKVILKKRDLGLSDRFNVYQINRIKTLRASSASLESNEQMGDIRALWELTI